VCCWSGKLQERGQSKEGGGGRIVRVEVGQPADEAVGERCGTFRVRQYLLREASEQWVCHEIFTTRLNHPDRPRPRGTVCGPDSWLHPLQWSSLTRLAYSGMLGWISNPWGFLCPPEEWKTCYLWMLPECGQVLESLTSWV
jgi:hypothetical protein